MNFYRILMTNLVILALAVVIFCFRSREGSSSSESVKVNTVDRSKTIPAQVQDAIIQDTVVGEEMASALEGLTPRAGLVPDVVFVDDHLTDETRELVDWLDEGRSIDLVIESIGGKTFGFRPHRVTTKDFQLSSSADTVIPSSVRVYQGRELLVDGGFGERASLAVVNDSISMAVEVEGARYLVETDPDSGELVAISLAESAHSCGVECSHESDGGDALGPACSITVDIDGLAVASVAAPEGMEAELPRFAATLVLPGEAEAASSASVSNISDAWVDHNYFRRGPIYDASLKDIVLLMVSGRSQTGSSSNLSSRAASYLTYAARVGDTYERQLGLRVWLQELVLIANDSGQDDIGDDLGPFSSWCTTHRPQSTYRWGHAAGWALVGGSGGGTVGRAWIGGYGGSRGYSVNERKWDWDVLNHELGHNVGAGHTSGGVMNSTIRNNNEDFFREIGDPGRGYTAAMDIYNTMSWSTRNYIYGPADLRHPEEIPFGRSDGVSTPLNTAVRFNPLTNDRTSVPFGATNILRLVEVGQVYPINSGVTSINGNEITFTPATGYTGRVWMTYTLGGSIGNKGVGWLHSADIVITVGGDNSDPTLSPALLTEDDVIETDFTGDIRFNPMLNDQGEGRLWAGDVHVRSQIDGDAESYSDQAFHLVSATVMIGNGSVSLETVDMTRNPGSEIDNTGYIIYTPGANELDQVVISYTVEDADGNQTSGNIYLDAVASVSVSTNRTELIESLGEVAVITFTRGTDADITLSETVSFSVSGEATVFGTEADYALAGYDTFSADTLSGKVVIPAGLFSKEIQIAVISDTVSEGDEKLFVTITASESLLVSTESSVGIDLSEEVYSGVELYTQNFDAFSLGTTLTDGWTNGQADDIDWTVGTGQTPTSRTGPFGDHTTGEGNYLYTEASSNFNKQADLISPSYDLLSLGQVNLKFAYSMVGSDTGELHMDVRIDGGAWINDVVFLNGGKVGASSWSTITTDMTPYLSANTQIRFRGITGSGDLSDMAIDDVQLFSKLAISPSILSHPVGTTIEGSEQLYLSVIATGSPAPIYQWKLDGVDISGATLPSYSIASVQPSDSGDYTCVVSNGVGSSVLSNAATVTVLARPSVSIDSPVDGTALPLGVGLILEATTSDDGPYALAWSKDSGPGTITFGDPAEEDTTAVFSEPGVYSITLTADDGALQQSETIEVDIGGSGGYTFSSLDVGNVSATGSSSQTGDVWTLQGSGNDIWNKADEFRFNYVEMSGDGEILARVTSQTNTNQWAKAGVMIRDSLASGSANATALITPGNGVVGQVRSVDGSSTENSRVSGQTTPIWVRLVRAGNTITSYYSDNGTDWEQIRVDSSFALTDPVYVGLAVTSHDDGTLSTATFDNISGTSLGGNLAPTVSAGADLDRHVGLDFALLGSASDGDDGPGSLTTAWTMVSGPADGTVAFTDASDPTTEANFDAAGTYVLRLTASDTLVKTFDETIVEVSDSSSAGDLWRQTYFGQTANSGDAADGNDYDGGGSVNLLERAFMTDPNNSNDDYFPIQGMMEVVGANYLSLTYRRLSNGSGTTGVDYTFADITYCVEHVQDLTATWSEGGITVVSILDDHPVAGVQTVTVRLNTATTDYMQSFMRLKVTSSD